MGKRGYPPEFRRRVLDLVEAGRKVAEVAHDLGISDQTIYNWRRQDRVDRGLEPGLTTAEQAELVAARSRGWVVLVLCGFEASNSSQWLVETRQVVRLQRLRVCSCRSQFARVSPVAR